MSRSTLLGSVAKGPGFVIGEALTQLAQENVLTTTLREGTGASIVKNGEFAFAIMAMQDHHYNDPRKPWYDKKQPKWEVLHNEDDRPHGYKGNYDDRIWAMSSFGLHPVGFPGQREVYEYRFKWRPEGRPDENGNYKFREEMTSFYFLNNVPYVAICRDADTKDGMPVRVEYLLVLRINNPYKAIHKTVDWFLQTEGFANRAARSFVGEFSAEQLFSETDEEDTLKREKENFSKRLRALSNCLIDEEGAPHPQGTKDVIGVTIITAELLRVIPTGEYAAEHQETLLAEFGAKRRAAARKVEGQGEADYIELTTTAQADGMRKMQDALASGAAKRLDAYAKHPELAATMMKYDAMASSKDKPGTDRVVVFDADATLQKLAGIVAGVKPK